MLIRISPYFCGVPNKSISQFKCVISNALPSMAPARLRILVVLLSFSRTKMTPPGGHAAFLPANEIVFWTGRSLFKVCIIKAQNLTFPVLMNKIPVY